MNRKIIILLAIFCFLTVGCGSKKIKKDKKMEKEIGFNVNFNIGKEQTVDNLKITDASLLLYNDGNTKYQANVTNESDSEVELKYIEIKFFDKDDKELDTFIGYIGSKLMMDESREMTCNKGTDLSQAVRVEYKIIK